MKQNRNNQLVTASWIAILGNSILSVSKIIIGFISGSLAVVGDGIDSATDVLTSIITLFTSKIVSKPPNPKHPFGYQKADDIAAKVLSFIIFFAGGQLAVSTIKKIIDGTQSQIPGMLAVYITLISILGKLFLSYYLKKTGKNLSSNMLIANAKNMQNDVIISISVLIGLISMHLFKLSIIDYITALVVSLWIIKTAFEIFMDSNVELLDGVKDESVYKAIFQAVAQVEGASNPHKVRTRQIGGMYLIDIDIEVDGNLPLNKAHKIANEVENKIKDNIESVYDIMIHIEPLGEAHKKEKFGVSKKNYQTDK